MTAGPDREFTTQKLTEMIHLLGLLMQIKPLWKAQEIFKFICSVPQHITTILL